MSTARLRIMFAIPALDHGGPDRVMFELLRSLDRERFAPSLLVSEPAGKYFEQLPSDVEVHVLGQQRSLLDRYPFRPALRVIRREAPDIVFGTLRMLITLGVVAGLFPQRTRLVLRPASPIAADFAALEKLSLVKHRLAHRLVVEALRRADAVICQSESMYRELARRFGRDHGLHVVANPIDVASIGRAAGNGSRTGTPALISVGRLVALKGFDVLLRALAIVRVVHPSVHLTICGEGPERHALARLSRELDLEQSVTFAGFVSNPLPAVRAADLFVLASHYDAFCNAALEALACGTPVVLTNCPGANAELVIPDLNGRLARDSDPADLARQINEGIADLPRYRRDAIIDDVERRFATPKVVAEYERILTSVMHR
jgi:glycosyltransferase involved in cell wall biosynthesis